MGHETEAKWRLRRAHLRRRRDRPADDVAAAGQALAARLVDLLDPAAGSTVAAYAALPGEPPTGPLLAALQQRGVRVLLPVLLADGALDWAAAERGAALVAGGAGTAAPDGPRLGPDAVSAVSALVVPGVAGDAAGGRLGRGGGSYDRALARVPPGVPVVLVLFDDEVVERVPVQPHDRRVTHVVTPARTVVALGMPSGLD